MCDGHLSKLTTEFLVFIFSLFLALLDKLYTWSPNISDFDWTNLDWKENPHQNYFQLHKTFVF